MEQIDSMLLALGAALLAIGVFIGMVAAKTENTTDDKVAGWFRRAGGWLRRLGRRDGGE